MPPELRAAGWAELWPPEFLVAAVLVAGVYLALVGPLRARHFPESAPVPVLRKLSFLAAVAAFWIAQGTPLDLLSDRYLFSAHMVQHCLLAYVMVPLGVLGVPDWMWRRLLNAPAVRRPFAALTRPTTALVLFNGLFSLYHLPYFYQLGLRNPGIHLLEHVVITVTAVFMWWPVVSPLAELPRLPEGPRVVYVVMNTLWQSLLSIVIEFVGYPLYPWYVAAPRILGSTPLIDQGLGAGMMMTASMAAYGAPVLTALVGLAERETGDAAPYPGMAEPRHS